LSVGGFALFLAFTFGVLLPHLEKAWPATRIADAIAPLRRCGTGPVGVLGFREPSTLFVLGHRSSGADAETIGGWMATGEEAIAVVEDRWQPTWPRPRSARSPAAAARRLRRGVQRHARLPAHLLDLRDRAGPARCRVQGRAALRLQGAAPATARRCLANLPLPLIAAI
jgi:hypothetical protein